MKIDKDIALKILAEKHILFGKKITKSQFDALKSSKYGKHLKETVYKSKFDSICEEISSGRNPKKDISERSLYSPYEINFNTNKDFINYLIHKIEDQFDISLLNSKLKKYNDMRLEDIVAFIKDFITKQEDNVHANTIEKIEDAIKDNRSVSSLLLNLRALAI